MSDDSLINLDTLTGEWACMLSVLSGITLQPSPSTHEVVRYLADLSSSQTLSTSWLSLVGGIFVFVLASNWLGALVPWSVLELPASELSAPTNDINVTAALALVASHSTFYTGWAEYRWHFPNKYVRPVAFLLPLNILEEFSKPLSLSFRLLGNVLADELTLAVLYGLAPLGIPIPIFLLGLFTSGIQAIVFATLTGAYIGETLESLI